MRGQITHKLILLWLYCCCFWYVPYLPGDRGSTVVKVLRYKSEGRWFDPRWCHWNFSLTQSFRSHYGPGVDPASNRIVPGLFPGGKKRPVRNADNLPPPCAVVTKSGNLNFLEPSGHLRVCNGTALPLPLPYLPSST